MSLRPYRRPESISAIPGGYAPTRRDSSLTREAAKRGGAALPVPVRRETALDRTGIPCGSAINSSPWKEWTEARQSPAAPAPGTRRLRDLPRDLQRPLESRLYHLRRVHHQDDNQISHLLDLHPDDLDALAATHGQP
jgi:hypothetical protein